MPRAEKIIWIFFAATSIQLAFLHPSVVLVSGERTNLFSGLLCFLTLAVALIFSKRGAIKLKSPEFLVSVALLLLAAVSGLSSPTPLSSSFRAFVLLASGLGGFWCARILLNTPENQHRFQWFCLYLLGGVVLLSLAGYFLSGRIQQFFNDSHTHPLTNVIFLLSFAPLSLLGEKSRPLVLLGAILLALSYATLCLSERLSVVFIPLGLVLLAVLVGALRWKHLLLALVLCGVAIGFFSQQILWFKLSRGYPYYRIENFFFSMSIAKQNPLFGIGLRAPRSQFLKDYQIKYPYTPKEKFTGDVAGIVTADNQILTFLAGLGFPFTVIYCLAVITLLAKLIAMTFRPPPGLFFHPLVILFPLGLALVHFQLYDGLLFAQNSWFFHILLGLIPMGKTVKAGLEAPVGDADLSYSTIGPNSGIGRAAGGQN